MNQQDRGGIVNRVSRAEIGNDMKMGDAMCCSKSNISEEENRV